MTRHIYKSTASGTVVAPPSKSYAHRMLICAGLSNHECKVENIQLSNDIIATLNCLKALGVDSRYDETSKTVYIKPSGKKEDLFDCLESGSTLRFFIPIASILNSKAKFTGSKRLFERGVEVYEDIFKQNNLMFEKDDCFINISGSLNAGYYKVKGNISSQYISGLLFSLPLLDNDSVIEIIPPIESIDYILITIDVLAKFGIEIINDLENHKLMIKGNQAYQALDTCVEGDYSNAAFLDAFNYIGGNVLISGLNEESLQGDKAYKEYFNILNNNEMPTIDISNTIDLGPILFVMAALLQGAKFTGIKRLRIKESDRVSCVCQELAKFGVKAIIEENTCIINKTLLHEPNGILYGHNDHRIVMALSVMLSKFGGIISGTLAVNKSFPTFFEVIKKLGVVVQDE